MADFVSAKKAITRGLSLSEWQEASKGATWIK